MSLLSTKRTREEHFEIGDFQLPPPGSFFFCFNKWPYWDQWPCMVCMCVCFVRGEEKKSELQTSCGRKKEEDEQVERHLSHLVFVVLLNIAVSIIFPPREMRLFCVDDVRLVCVPSPAAPVRRAQRAKVTRVEPRCLLKKSLRFKQPSKGGGRTNRWLKPPSSSSSSFSHEP